MLDPAKSQAVDRHTGMWCGCLLLDCSHNELPGMTWNLGCHSRQVESGSPASGYLYPWEPGDESWRSHAGIPGVRTRSKAADLLDGAAGNELGRRH